MIELVYDAVPNGALAMFVERNLINAAIASTGVSESYPVNFFLRNARGEWLGGLLGYVWGGWLYVRILWVTEALRNQGYGTRLLREAEALAREHGAFAVTLETHSFQAPAFYRKHGYHEFGRLEDFPPGHAKLFFRKQLNG